MDGNLKMELNIDITYLNGDSIIRSNKEFLIRESSFFSAKFENWNNENLITLMIDSNAFAAFKFFHDNIFNSLFDPNRMSIEEKIRMIEVSKEYLFKNIYDTLFENLKNVTHENYWEILSYSVQFDEKILLGLCAQFISQNIPNYFNNPNFTSLDSVSLTYLLKQDTFNCDEEEIFNAIMNWHEKHPEVDLDQILREAIRTEFLPSYIRNNLTSHLENEYRNDIHRHWVPKFPLLPVDHFELKVTNKSIRSAIREDSQLELLATLKKNYRVNHISFKFKENEQMKYRIDISIDGKSWEEVVNYLDYRCHGQQEIYFKPFITKYILLTATEFRKSLLPIHSSYESASSSSLLDKIENFEIKFTENQQLMSNPDRFLIPNYNIAYLCIGPGIGDGINANFTCNKNKTTEQKYRNLFRGHTHKDCGEYILQLPQPCQISKIEFLIPDLKGKTYPALYRIMSCLKHSGDVNPNQWTTIYESPEVKFPGGRYGLQEINFKEETNMTFIRIIPTKLFNPRKPNTFYIVDFKCFGL